MNEKQQQLTFDKGITTAPSDAICSDNALEDCVGMTYKDGEHHVIQHPTLYATQASGKIVYVHKFNNDARYIMLVGTTLMWAKRDSQGVLHTNSTALGNGFTKTPQITAIGKTIIVAAPEGLRCFIWKVSDDSYEDIGVIPDMQISFYMKNDQVNLNDRLIRNTAKCTGIVSGNPAEIAEDKQEDYNNLVIGLYSKNKKEVAQKKGFCEPFFVRAALELKDHSYIYIGQPVLMFPSITKGTFFGLDNSQLTASTFFYHLYCTQWTDYSKYSDIVESVVLFVSDYILLYDTGVDQTITYFPPVPGEGALQPLAHDSISYNNTYERRNVYDTYRTTHYECLVEKTEEEILNEISSKSVFYKFCSLGLKRVRDLNTASKIDAHTLENLTTQDQLEYDDYYSRCRLNADFLFAYNSRLNISSVKRGFFDGFTTFLPYYEYAVSGQPAQNRYIIYVTIETDSGDVTVSKSFVSSEIMGLYFFYPDPRAKRLVIKKNGVYVLDTELKEHTGLNGAYYLKELPKQNSAYTTSQPVTVTDEPVVTVNPEEILPNYIITSEVDNPFVFKSSGYYRVGTGKILAMSSNTQALSQGQHGQFPLLVFTDEGIWALSVASTGYYSDNDPASREVIYPDNPTLVQTDDAVFFVSAKGLMRVDGKIVTCVSEQMNGKTNNGIAGIEFIDYIKGSKIAYDYRDSLLWIINPVANRQAQCKHCYVYSMKTGTISKYDLGYDAGNSYIEDVINMYPDTLLQGGSNVFSLLERSALSDQEGRDTYTALLKTRPMKLENALALKSILGMQHIKSLSDGAGMTLIIEASNNLKSWVELKSLRGMPWKYYRFTYTFTNLKAVDSFAGTILITQERRTLKLR